MMQNKDEQKKLKELKDIADYEARVNTILSIKDKKTFAKETENLLGEHQFTTPFEWKKYESFLIKLFIQAAIQENEPAIDALLGHFSPTYESVLKGQAPEVQQKIVQAVKKTNLRRMIFNKTDFTNDGEFRKWTPLHGAARDGDASLVKILLDRKADVNVRTYVEDTEDVNDNGTPLHQAVLNDNPVTIKLLFESGANPEEKIYTANGRITARMTAMRLAVGRAKILALEELIHQGVELPNSIRFITRVRNQELYILFKTLLDAGFNPNSIILPENQTALAIAITIRNYDLAKLLFEAGARTNEPSVISALDKLAKESKSEKATCWSRNQLSEKGIEFFPAKRLLDLFYENNNLLEYSDHYLDSLLETDFTGLSEALDPHLPKELYPLIFSQYKRQAAEELISMAEKRQTDIVKALEDSAQDILPLPRHFQTLLHTLKTSLTLIPPHAFGRAKMIALIVDAVRNYAATYNEERILQQNQNSNQFSKLWSRRPELSKKELLNTPFFNTLKKIVGDDEVITEALKGEAVSLAQKVPPVTQRAEDKKPVVSATTPPSQISPPPMSVSSIPFTTTSLQEHQAAQLALMQVAQFEEQNRQDEAIKTIKEILKEKTSEFKIGPEGIVDLDSIRTKQQLDTWLETYGNRHLLQQLKVQILNHAGTCYDPQQLRVLSVCRSLLESVDLNLLPEKTSREVPPSTLEVPRDEKKSTPLRETKIRPTKMDKLVDVARYPSLQILVIKTQRPLTVQEGKNQLKILRDQKEAGAFVQEDSERPNTLNLIVYDPTSSQTHPKGRSVKYFLSYNINEKNEGEWRIWVPDRIKFNHQSSDAVEPAHDAFSKSVHSEEALNKLWPFVKSRLPDVGKWIGLPAEVTLKMKKVDDHAVNGVDAERSYQTTPGVI